MALKWLSALVASASLGIFATANLIEGVGVPHVVNLALVAICVGSASLVVVAELYQRLDSRLTAVSDFVISRLDEQDNRAERGLEALISQADGTVIPLAPRRSR